MRKLSTILAGFMIVLCLGGIFWLFAGKSILDILNAPQQVIDTSNEFMQTLENEDYEDAYRMILGERQPDFGGSVQGMKQFIEGKQWSVPSSWHFTSSKADSEQGIVVGSVTYAETVEESIQIVLRKAHGAWKIVEITIQ
jgi:hypothetical protein